MLGQKQETEIGSMEKPYNSSLPVLSIGWLSPTVPRKWHVNSFFPMLNSKILALIWRNTAYFVQKSYLATSEQVAERLETQNFSYFFYFLQCNMVFRIVNPFSWIWNALSSENSCPSSMPLLLTCICHYDRKIFPVCWILIGERHFENGSRPRVPLNDCVIAWALVPVNCSKGG